MKMELKSSPTIKLLDRMSYGEKNDDENLQTLLDWKTFMQNQEEGIGKNHSTPHHLAPLMMNSTYMNMAMLLDDIDKTTLMSTLMRTLNFCQSCRWKGGSITCDERKDYLIAHYRVSPLEAIEGVMKEKGCANKSIY